MLGNENRMTFYWSLFTIVFQILRRYSGLNEIDSVLSDCIDTFILDILPVFFGQFEFGSEPGSFQSFQNSRCPVCHLVPASYYGRLSEIQISKTAA